eukprot:superscaffoldBa00015755_g26691
MCVTDRGNKQVSDLLAVIPLGHAGCQSDLEHGVALMDFLQTCVCASTLLHDLQPGDWVVIKDLRRKHWLQTLARSIPGRSQSQQRNTAANPDDRRTNHTRTKREDQQHKDEQRKNNTRNHSVNPTDTGQTCRVTPPHYTMRHLILIPSCLVMLTDAYTYEPAKTISLTEGQSVTFTCTV